MEMASCMDAHFYFFAALDIARNARNGSEAVKILVQHSRTH